MLKFLSILMIIIFPTPLIANSYYPVSKGDEVPFDGICIKEETSINIAKQKIELIELQRTHTIKSETWKFKEDKYMVGLTERDKRIETLEDKMESWWTRNSLSVGIAIGIAVGIGLSAASAKALNEATK